MSEPRRDHHGRYLIAPHGGGEAVAHTRCTTVAKTLDDTGALDKWKQRHVAKGLAVREDLLALAQATPVTDKSTLNRVCADAMDAAASSGRANIGTALHTFTEQVDRGEDVTVPPRWDADVRAYVECCKQNGLTVHPEWIECIAVCSALDEPVAGTIDRILGMENAMALGIADLKTGRDLAYQWRSIAIQLAIYSRSETLYDPETEQHTPMPPVDQDRGIVFHLPAGEGVCTPYFVDLNAGWEAAQMSVATRQWRKRRDLASPLTTQAELEPAA